LALDSLSRQLERRLNAIQGAIDRSLTAPASPPKLDRWALQDGFISHAWQAWGVFCRELIIQSALGVPTAANLATGSPHAGRPVGELAWIGMRAAKGDAFHNVQTIRGSYQEPTWGDGAKFQQIATAFQLVNEQTILSGVLSAGRIVRHMQIIRNASAHTNSETLAEVRSLAPFYITVPIRMPGDAIFWADPNSGDFIYRFWTSRLIAAARQAVG